jgi:uncharacterized membrane protein YfcA
VSVAEIVGLIFAAAAAGVVNAVAGGGTLITFPTLLFFGTSPLVANATSTLALMLGTGGSVFGYRKHMETVKPWLLRFTAVSVAGGLIGSALLTRTDEQVFSRLVPFLILFATVVFVAQGAVRKLALGGLAEGGEESRHHVTAAIAFQFLVAIYGGYFGAGIGILMLATLGFIGLNNIHEMNTLKTVLNTLINLVAAILFTATGLIHWPKAGIMTIGALGGYFLGAHFSQRISQKTVRTAITVIGFTLAAITFYEEFLGGR